MTFRKRCELFLAAAVSLAWMLSAFAAGVLAEGAIHPILKRRASDTQALVNSVARTTGATARKVSITSRDGIKLDAWWLARPDAGSPGVMVCHGVADSAFGAMGFALLFLNHGYSILLPESRGHGESGGFVTYGVLEAGDVVQWLGWMNSNGITSVYGFGESLGAAILVQALAGGAEFRSIVAESPYTSFEDIADERVGREVPSPVAMLLVREGIWYVRVRHGMNLMNARVDEAITRVHSPILLVHGLADNETSPQNSIRLAQLNSEWTTLWLVAGARHTGAYAADPVGFENRVLGGFDN